MPDDDQPISFHLNLTPDTDQVDETPAPRLRAGEPTPPASNTGDYSNRGSRRLFESLADRDVRPRAKRLVAEAFGKNRAGRPNAVAAAQHLGVHPSTVRRWIRDGLPKKPSPAAHQLRSTWKNSPAGRRASISPQRRRSLTTGGAYGGASLGGSVTGRVWLDTDEARNGMERSFHFALSNTAAQEMADAVMRGDDQRAHQLFEQGLEGFGSSVRVDISDVGWQL